MKRAADATDFLSTVSRRSDQVIARCYYCKKCASGCPVASFCEHLPYELLRMVQLGLEEDALSSALVWLCSACGTCGARCPNDIDIGKVSDALKEMCVEKRVKVGENEVRLFHKLFLGNLKRFGRLHEATLLGVLKLRTGRVFDDMDLGLKLMKKGKLRLAPSIVKGRREIKRFFREIGANRVRNAERDSSSEVE